MYRYKGFSTLLDSFRKLGLLSSEPIRGFENWDQFLIGSTGAVVGQEVKKGDMGSVFRDILASRQEETEEALRWSVFRTQLQCVHDTDIQAWPTTIRDRVRHD
jgi:hypothetical protein